MIKSVKEEIIEFLKEAAPKIEKQDYAPFSVFIKEDGESDEPTYHKYMLHSICGNGDCVVENPKTKIIEPRELSDINLECLDSLLTFINELKTKTDYELSK